METDLLSLLFDSFITSIQSFITNDISVILLGMLSLMFIVFAFCKIIEIFNVGMTKGEIGAKNAFDRWQVNKGTWREPLMREEYLRSLNEVRAERKSNVSK